MYPLDFNYLYGKPSCTARFKQYCEDFKVEEHLGFELTGEGEHVCLWVKKIGENTDYLARQLAKFAGIAAKNVSYAGLKDRQAETYQWFSLYIPGKVTPDFNEFELPGVTILKVIRHNKKLRTGCLTGNSFSIVLREVSDKESLQIVLDKIQQGVPNYFGNQRFGFDGHNVNAALQLFNGRKVKDRFKRGMYLSAARSYLFNCVISQRISDNLQSTPLLGDCVQFVANRSFFPLPDLSEQTLQRLTTREVCLTAPLWGAGELTSCDDAKQYELDCLSSFAALQVGLAKEGLKQERRPLLLIPEKFNYQWLDENKVTIDFYLPAGCYATSIIRELIEMNA
ncbi:tRNA pseudouridine(13) synthase TruD [Psychromonas sp. RZ22]|nr:tRNA pseudouridine(13) synthase TruD [Psychromonas sp. RZ22]